MFYIMYLTSLCTRRKWPQPTFTPQRTPNGWSCIVTVNNREYSTERTHYMSAELAKNAAATHAYMICRNFSVNDGRFPGQRPECGAQGMPVAIGSGRKGKKSSSKAVAADDIGKGATEGSGAEDWPCEEDISPGAGGQLPSYGGFESEVSGGESPRSVDSAIALPGSQGAKGSGVACACGRARTCFGGRCEYCVHDARWLTT